MADLDPTAEEFNILASMMKHITTNLVGVTGPPTDLAAANIWWPNSTFDPNSADYYLRLTLRDTEGRHYHNTDGADGGSVKEWLALLDLFMKREFTARSLGVFPNTKTLVRSEFKISDAIDVQDWRAGGGSSIGKLIVRGREPREIAPEGDWLSAGWTVRLQWIEHDAAA